MPINSASTGLIRQRSASWRPRSVSSRKRSNWRSARWTRSWRAGSSVSYILEPTAALSELYQSGIVVRDPEFDSLAAGGGTHVDMPFWQDLSGDREVLSDSVS